MTGTEGNTGSTVQANSVRTRGTEDPGLGFAAGPNPRITTRMIRNARVDLALHERRPATGSGHPLLMLHGLGEQSPSKTPDDLAAWPGGIWALDFTGHGGSSVPAGGGYTCELLMSDADAALAVLGPLTIYGRGLGGYVGLLLAGARAPDIKGLIIDDGPGIRGGGAEPGSQSLEGIGPGAAYARATPDPFALIELASDIRPPDYAARFVRLAVEGSSLETAVAVVAVARPPWLAGLLAEYGVVESRLADTVRLFAGG